MWLISALGLALLVGAAVVAIRWIQSEKAVGTDGRGDWEKTLVDCRDLRDRGGLSEEEFRKIQAFVEPRIRTAAPDAAESRKAIPERVDPDHDHERT